MVWNIGDVDDSGNTAWSNVGNETNSDNSNNLGVTLENVGNIDNSSEETNTSETTIVDSGNVDSGNTDWSIDGSFNDNSDNSDNSVDAVVTVDSHNSYWDKSTEDNSTNAGVREYNTGFSGWGGAGAGGGNAAIYSQSTIVDQSVNQNVVGGGIGQDFSNSAVTASGEGAVAAGGDVSISRSLDASTNFDAEGDINLNNTTEITTWDNVGNTTDISVELTDNSQDWTVDNSFNDESVNVDLTDSFNDDFSSTETENWTINTNVIWGSGNSEVVDVQVPDLDLDA